VNSANPLERLAAALLIRGELTKRLDKLMTTRSVNYLTMRSGQS